MKIEHPEVTLADEARCGVKEEVRSGFLDWLTSFVVQGDDGETYVCGGSILSLAVEQLDLVSIGLSKGAGRRQPKGTLRIERKETQVIVTCGEQFRAECNADKSWHLFLSLPSQKYRAELWHRPQGFPLWYGRETPSALTQHSVTYGYNWAGAVEGRLEYEGKRVNVRGYGIRERYVAVDSSAAELGGWEDWGFIAFREFHS